MDHSLGRRSLLQIAPLLAFQAGFKKDPEQRYGLLCFLSPSLGVGSLPAQGEGAQVEPPLETLLGPEQNRAQAPEVAERLHLLPNKVRPRFHLVGGNR